jgi:hypothetical protein
MGKAQSAPIKTLLILAFFPQIMDKMTGFNSVLLLNRLLTEVGKNVGGDFQRIPVPAAVSSK